MVQIIQCTYKNYFCVYVGAMHMRVQLHAFVFTHGVQKKEQVSSVIFSYSFQVGSVLKTRDCVFSARLEASKPWSPYCWGYKHTRTAQLGRT